MRLAIPNLDQEEQIHQTGIGLINLLGNDLFSAVNLEMEKTEGVEWLTNYRKSNLVYLNYNFNDPSNLLKELLRVSSSPLRTPIRKLISPKEIVAFFNRLQIVLDDRNDWVHHNSFFTIENLKTLILNIYPIAEKMKLQLISECDFLLSKLDGVEADLPQTEHPIVASTKSESDSEWTDEIKEVVSENERAVGELIEDKFLEFSYVLHLTGEIRNRKNNQLLSEVQPQFAASLGMVLIARKPTGGRLRITRDGTIVAYFENHWGYLGKVLPDQWFPDHLFFSV